jgi:hypothetical protein
MVRQDRKDRRTYRRKNVSRVVELVDRLRIATKVACLELFAVIKGYRRR